MRTQPAEGFRITGGKGFQITFSNGWTVSVQFGPGNYCENYNADSMAAMTNRYLGSRDAEIAAWDRDNKWLRFEHDEVKGRCSPNEVLEFMDRVAAFT